MPALIAVVVVALTPTAAPARTPDATGWWWAAQQQGLPVRVPPPPFVPPRGLYVAAGPQGTEAFAAVRLRLAMDEEAEELVLRVARVDGSPVLGLCLVIGDFPVAEGDALSQAPPVDCKGGSALGRLDPDGAAARFPLAGLARHGSIGVAVMPGAPGAGGRFSVAFAPPADDAVHTVSTAAPAEPAPDVEPPPSAGPPRGRPLRPPPEQFVPAATRLIRTSLDPDPGGASAPSLDGAGDLAPLEPVGLAAASPTRASAGSAPPPIGSGRLRALGALALVTAGAAALVLARRPRRTARLLVPLPDRR